MTVVLIIGFALLTETLVNSNFLNFVIVRDGHMLVASVLPLVGALMATLFWLTDRPGRWRAIFWTLVIANALTMGTMLHKDIVAAATSGVTTGIHDGAVQTNEAAKFLLRGVNPYSADFSQTTFGNFPSPVGARFPNVAWTHYAYPPANFLLTIPFIWVQSLISWSDARLLYSLAFVVLAGSLILTQKTWLSRIVTAILTIGNPLLWLFAVAGFNDSLMLLGLVGAALCFRRRQWLWAGILFGLALASKQTAWALMPVWALWLYQTSGKHAASRSDIKKILIGTIAVVAVLILPFIIWHWSAFYDDTVRYISGAIPNSFPIAGPTLLQFLNSYRLISSPYAAFPSYLIQLAVAIPILFLLRSSFHRQPTVGRLLIGSAIFFLAIFSVGRNSSPNYLMTALTLVVAGFALESDVQPTNGAPDEH